MTFPSLTPAFLSLTLSPHQAEPLSPSVNDFPLSLASPVSQSSPLGEILFTQLIFESGGLLFETSPEREAPMLR